MHLLPTPDDYSSPRSSSPPPSSYTSIPSGIQDQLLEVTVVGCNNLKDTKWISRQDPYVCVEYANTKFRTRTCTDGHKNPTFREKFVFSLFEGLRELSVNVWNSNTLSKDDFIGSGRVQLQKVLSQGYDDAAWTLQCNRGRSAGEVKLILHYANVKSAKSGGKPMPGHAPTAPPYVAPAAYHAPPYTTPPPPSAAPYHPTASYPPSPFPSYPAPPAHSSVYPPSPYPPPPQPTAYFPQPYPPAAYPLHTYPPPPQGSPYYPAGYCSGTYPPPY
ncbi:hypothetical protein MRB53_017357 [Persea americana]|uniref:Uncharacterized protein n=1 Tax=Persea americana TaxID=3435 RepID=A0ACC2M5C1_PERAE|nr:hypothetical protein MRB53_017357 [Persea americana]